VLTAETKRRLDACRDILVGKLPLPTDQIELITLALIYKFMDDRDEESVRLGGKRSFFVGPLEKYRWRALLPQTVSADERMNLFAEGIETIGKAEHLPALFRDIFRNSFLKFRDGRILTLFLNEVNGFVYSHSEELGNAFEYLLKTMGIQAENGQFRTPRHMINFMVACLDPQPNDRILDPACGTGGFLVSCYKHILAQHTSAGSKIPGDKLTHDQRQKVYSNLTGYDVTDLMVKLSKVNLFLHGFPDPAIHIYDTLTNDARWNEKADLILANPPFMTPKGGVSPHTKFRVAAKKSEVLFTDYIAEHLTPDGRGAVIVPNGIVATTQNAYVKLRRFLIEDSLVAVVSLPGGVFNPYSPVKTSILFLDKRLSRQRKQILLVKINADGFDLGAKRYPVEQNDLPEAERVIHSWFAGNREEVNATRIVCRLIEKTELLANKDVTLNVERYTGGAPAEHEYKIATIGELCLDMQSGYSCSSNKRTATGVPHLRSQNITAEGQLTWEGVKFVPLKIAAENDSYALRRGDILFNNTNSVELVGKTCLFDSAESAHYSNHTTRLRVDGTRVLPRFVALSLHQLFKRGHFAKICTRWVGQAGVSTTLLKEVEIPLLPLEEQERIVGEIDSYQKVIDGARQILAGYNPQLDIDPGWETVRLDEICEIKRGRFSHRPRNAPEFYGGRYPFLQTGDVVRAKGRSVTHTQTLNERGLAVSKLFQPTIVLITIAANIGDTALLTYPACFTDSVVGLIPNGRVLPEFLEFAMRGKKQTLDSLAPQAAQKNITVETLREIEIPLPPMDEQKRIVTELNAEAAQMDAVNALIPKFEAKIQRVLDRLWQITSGEPASNAAA